MRSKKSLLLGIVALMAAFYFMSSCFNRDACFGNYGSRGDLVRWHVTQGCEVYKDGKWVPADTLDTP